ncbi:MAG: hypothetical protein GOV15_00615 [Candidatus Diapherotrites archaeon]|nr:hypothetical protein [Candidatus Diapherotrites archaeon]
MASIKASVTEMDGDLARLTEDLVLITPARVKIVKRKQ